MAPKKSQEAATVAGNSPTLASSDSFSDFMNQMTKVRVETKTDARSQVLLGLSQVLIVQSEAVMHLANIANTAPEVFDHVSQSSKPVE